MQYFSIGDICKSRFWASIEFKPTGTGFRIGKTYGGTKTGLVICARRVVIIAHIR